MKNIFNFLIILFISFLLSGCGKNGELDTYSVLAPPPSPPTPDLNNSAPQTPECGCCECNENLCSCDCPEEPVDPNDTEDPANDEGEKNVPLFHFRPADVVFNYLPKYGEELPDKPFEPEEEGEPKPKGPQTCLHINQPAAKWWLAHILTGGILNITNVVGQDFLYEELPEGTHIVVGAGLPGWDETLLEIDYFVGLPVLTGETKTYSPDNVTFTYNGLISIDPVLGYLEIEGKIECKGKSFHVADTNKWYKFQTCSVIGGVNSPIAVTIGSSSHEVFFGLSKKFEGFDPEPANFHFTGGSINIDGISHTPPFDMPPEILQCLNN